MSTQLTSYAHFDSYILLSRLSCCGDPTDFCAECRERQAACRSDGVRRATRSDLLQTNFNGAPSFAAIAAKEAINADIIASFLLLPHATMPNSPAKPQGRPRHRPVHYRNEKVASDNDASAGHSNTSWGRTPLKVMEKGADALWATGQGSAAHFKLSAMRTNFERLGAPIFVMTFARWISTLLSARAKSLATEAFD